MAYVLPLIILITALAALIFLAANSYEAYQHYLDEEEKAAEGKFTANSRKNFKASLKPEKKKKKWKIFNTGFENYPHLTNIFGKKKKVEKIHHKEILKVLLGLDDEKLGELLELYKQEFGAGAARYARKTYRKWEKGEVKPIKQTFERFMIHLPKVMDFDLKCEVLRHLMEEYCARDNHNLTVYTDDWEKTLEPLVKQLIDKPYTSRLPKQIEDRLKWLAYDDMEIARQLLAESNVQEGKIAVSMLEEEFKNIEYLLANTKGKRKVTHKLKFPYGTINLEIKRR